MTGPLRYVCTHPDCEFFTGVVGLPVSTLETRSAALAPDFDDLRPGEMPCPACHQVTPARNGFLLAAPGPEHQDEGLVVAKQVAELGIWAVAKPAESLLRTATRVVDFGSGAPDAPEASQEHIAGPAVVEGVVLRQAPFDGHTLVFGNQDRFIESSWVEAEPRYGLKQEPPLPHAAAEPTYIRELQKDLILLGYFSKSRGTPKKSGGVFDAQTLGAVLALKHDLMKVYGIEVADEESPLGAGPIDAESFRNPIRYQRTIVAPMRLVSAWSKAWSRTSTLRSLSELLSTKAKAKTQEKNRSKVEAELGAIRDELHAWPFRVVLETPAKSAGPFEERAPTVDLDDLEPPDGSPAHESIKALFDAPAFSQDGLNTRSKNLSVLRKLTTEVVQGADTTLAHCEEIEKSITDLAAAGDDPAAWATLRKPVEEMVAIGRTFASLVRFFALNLSVQIEAWTEHLREIGSVGPATAFYLKAMREGARIGPGQRPAYRLALNPGDWGGVDEGGQFIRDECRGRGDNRGAKKATTMPEILVLQFFANESRMTFTSNLAPFNLNATDKKLSFPRLGVDMNSPAKGTFDPVCSFAGEWVFARGWGVGQETEQETTIDGVELRRGLPIMPEGADEVVHPKSFADKDASFASCLDRKAIARFNKRGNRRDCTYGELPKPYYDCHGCLKRFFDRGWLGSGKEHRGGVIVPRGKGTFGQLSGASGFWLDLEGLTKFSGDGTTPTPDPVKITAAENDFRMMFRIEVTPLDLSDEMDSAVAAVLGRGPDIKDSVRAVAKDRGMSDEDRATLAQRVVDHMDVRRDLPCSWCHVRIGYAGQGPQAFGSLFRMLKVVGDLETDDVVKKHILEASAIRVKEHEEKP